VPDWPGNTRSTTSQIAYTMFVGEILDIKVEEPVSRQKTWILWTKAIQLAMDSMAYMTAFPPLLMEIEKIIYQKSGSGSKSCLIFRRFMIRPDLIIWPDWAVVIFE
jgi:hypothetical protein